MKLFIYVLFFVGSAAAQDYTTNKCVFIFDHQAYLNDEIAQTQVRLEENLFKVDRPLKQDGLNEGYFNFFGQRFFKTIENMNFSRQRWLDAGAGEAKALLAVRSQKLFNVPKSNYQKNFPAFVALGYERPAGVLDRGPGYRYISGRRIEEISNAEIGKFDLITDLYGPISYSHQLDRVLQKYLDLLTKQGELFIVNYWEVVHFRDGRELNLLEWLRSIPGVLAEPTDQGIYITKTQNKINVPRLELIDYHSSAPPVREFLQAD